MKHSRLLWIRYLLFGSRRQVGIVAEESVVFAAAFVENAVQK